MAAKKKKPAKKPVKKTKKRDKKPKLPAISPSMQALMDRSGTFESDCRLTEFVYELLRDHVPASVVEKMVIGILDESRKAPTVQYCNGWLAAYAADVAQRLLS